MRLNTPTTNMRYDISDTQTIVSTTDLQGNITYANPYFVEVSGFALDELIGAPQNIVRHPDMPAEAFADLWRTIQSGQSWSGMVKNRCKNGDYYWVNANVTPIVEEGKTVGFMSVRTKPSQAQVDAAAALYAALKDGNPQRLAISHGAPVTTGLWARLRRRASMSSGAHIALNLGLMLATLAALGLYLSFAGSGAGGKAWLQALTVLAMLAGARLWYMLEATVLGPLRQALAASRIMAGGDLTGSTLSARDDEGGQLLRVLGQLRVNLRAIVSDVRNNSQRIGISTREIATGNMDLSGRTESQASSLEETASSMEELASTVQQNAGNAEQATRMASAASAVAGVGGEVVTEVVVTMHAISAASKKIVDIIGIIEGIAFQTNILALNAAVEAARAGEQGRGFAVVASEVRSLAQRSATAAKEIKQLIDVSIEKVDAGTMLAARAGNTMREIIASVEKVNQVMGDISTASREQSAGIAQVNGAVTQMDEVTQQNAALVEQAAAAAASLQEQADHLISALRVFKLDSRGARHRPENSRPLAIVPATSLALPVRLALR
ncbi:MAG TPA: methyl-accepting chemotaxis protein [Telluria sp.]